MKANLALVVLAIAATAITATASAQELKPGLWEVTSTMTSASGELEKANAQMQKELAGMPAEQRKMMEDMMAKQGVKMGAGSSADSFNPGGSVMPQTVWRSWYSFQPEPAR